jgi:hypothetical protein
MNEGSKMRFGLSRSGRTGARGIALFGSLATLGFGTLTLFNAYLLSNAWIPLVLAQSGPMQGNWPTFSRALSSGDVVRDDALAAIAGAGLFVGALIVAVMRWQQSQQAKADRVVRAVMALLFAFAALLGIVHYFHVAITLDIDDRRHMLMSYLFFFGMSAVIIGDLCCNLVLSRMLPAGTDSAYTPLHRATGAAVLGASAVFLLTFILKDVAANPWAQETQHVFVMAETGWIVLAHGYALLYLPVLRAYFAAQA